MLTRDLPLLPFLLRRLRENYSTGANGVLFGAFEESCNPIISHRSFNGVPSSPFLHTFCGHTFVNLENALWHALFGNRLGYGERYGFPASVVFFFFFVILGRLGVWIESHCFS